MSNKQAFNAKFVSIFSADRYYRIYVIDNQIFFIRLGGQSILRDALAHQFGLLGGIIGNYFKKKAEKKKDELIQKIDLKTPMELLPAHKHNFKTNVMEFNTISIDPISFIATHGPGVGFWKFQLSNNKKYKFQFEKNEDLKNALDILPNIFTTKIIIHVEWDENKKKYKKINKK